MTYLMLGDLVWAPLLFFFSASFLVAPRHRTMLLPRHPPRSCATCVLATETLSLGFPTIFGQIFTCTSQEYWSSMAAVRRRHGRLPRKRSPPQRKITAPQHHALAWAVRTGPRPASCSTSSLLTSVSIVVSVGFTLHQVLFC